MSAQDARELIQFEAVKAWIDSNKKGTLVLPTGVGKTFTAATVISGLIEKKRIATALVVVPTVNLIRQWKNEFDKWNCSKKGVTFQCLKTAFRSESRYDLIVVDEIHTALSPKYRKVFSVEHSFILGLTATLPRNEEYREVLRINCPVVYTKTVNDVVGEVTSDYKIYNVAVKMNLKDSSKYKVFNAQFNKARIGLSVIKKRNPEFNALSIFDMAKIFSVYKMNAGYDTELLKHSKAFWSAMTLRKQVCYNAISKIKIIKNLITIFPGKKWIIFNKSIAFADLLGKEIPNSRVFHSKVEDREAILEDFTNNKFSVLIAVDGLNAGFNVPNIDAAICASGVSTELTQIQQLGQFGLYLLNSVKPKS